MAKEIKAKTATEMALQLYPLVQEMLEDQLEHNQAECLTPLGGVNDCLYNLRRKR